ncbi:MAG: response regulator [Desulfobacterales bacterium]|nr:response regulator [Desulfobacterales bacterium]
MESHNILIVDDVPNNLKLLGNILKQNGYKVAAANSGEHALNFISNKQPDLILLDIMMPGMDGYEVCRRIKANDKTKDIPVIFVTARTDMDSIIKGLELGALDYINKPFNQKEVLLRIENQIKIKSLTNSLIKKNELLEEKQRIIMDDLDAAAEIQKSLVPEPYEQFKGINICHSFIPCKKVGGDIYNLIPLDDSHIAIYIIDIMGHGVASSMVSLLVSQTLNQKDKSFIINDNKQIVSPDMVLRKLDSEFPFERFEKFFSIFYMVLNTLNGKILYSNAGHPIPILFKKNNDIEFLEERGTFIGLGEPVPFLVGETKIEAGERIFFYTDGIVEEKNKENLEFGVDNFKKYILDSMNEPLNKVCNIVLKALKQFIQKDDFNDDITLLGVEYI